MGNEKITSKSAGYIPLSSHYSPMLSHVQTEICKLICCCKQTSCFAPNYLRFAATLMGSGEMTQSGPPKRKSLSWGPHNSYFTMVYGTYTSSTAQGGGGSFKNRKPIGEVGCCESGMAERSH